MADIEIIADATSVKEATNEVNRLRSAMQKVNKSVNTAKATTQYKKVKSTVQQYSKSLTNNATTAKKASASQENLTKDVQQQAKATKTATAAQQRYNNTLKKGQNQYSTYNTATYQANQKTKRFASVGLQQAGYQVGDFAVQLQGGTNAAVAFGQQGSQLLGIFGAFGAVLGAVLAITTAVVAPMLDSADAGGKMADEFQNLKAQLKPIEPLLSSVKAAANGLKEAFFDATNSVLNNLDRVLVYAGTLATFFAGKWVTSFVAARVATLSLSGALVTLRATITSLLARTGIGLLIVGAGELTLRFTKLVSATGGFGNALTLLGTVAKGVWEGIKTSATAIPPALSSVWGRVKSDFLSLVADLAGTWAGFLESLSMKGSVESFNRNTGEWKTVKSPFGKFFEGASGSAKQASEDFQKASEAASIAADTMSTISGGRLTSGMVESGEALDKLRAAMKKADEEGKRINIRDWFGGVGAGEDSEGGGSTTKDSLEAFRKQLDLQEQLIGKTSERKRILKELGVEFVRQNPQIVEGLEAQIQQIDEMTERENQIKKLGELIKSSLGDAFMSIVDGSKSAGEAFKDMARLVLKQAFEMMVIKPLLDSLFGGGSSGGGSGFFSALFNANGNAFNKGQQLTAYANGGVVNSPTVFPMANGAGLMGEAGPEAIMPLKRGKNGKLGVESSGSEKPVVINQSFNFSANGDESVKRIIAQAAPDIANLTQKQIMDERRRGGAMKSTFG